MITGAAAAISSLKGGRGECQYCHKMENNVAYHESHECERKKILDVEKKLAETMKKLQEMPPPTREKVAKQFAASARIRKQLDECGKMSLTDIDNPRYK